MRKIRDTGYAMPPIWPFAGCVGIEEAFTSGLIVIAHPESRIPHPVSRIPYPVSRITA
ncbi:MAG TPA: hypothetical protein VHM26_09345 [Chitinophagaceae bacterium]|nr:hypothetical protein [Chitinophagaceae bacterium]